MGRPFVFVLIIFSATKLPSCAISQDTAYINYLVYEHVSNSVYPFETDTAQPDIVL